MESPLEHSIAWYRSLPLAHRQDIAALVSFCPGLALDLTAMDGDAIPDRFVELVRTYRSGGLKEFGAALALRSFVQMAVIDKRSHRSDWKETEEMLATLGEQHDSETFRTKAAETPFRGEQWIISCAKWVQLVAGPMSDRAVKTLLP